MKLTSKQKLYAKLFLSVLILIIGTHLSSKLENKWFYLIGSLITYSIVISFVLNFKIELPKTKKQHKILPLIFFYVTLSILGLYLITNWHIPIIFNKLIGNNYVDVLTLNKSFYIIISSIIIFPINRRIVF